MNAKKTAVTSVVSDENLEKVTGGYVYHHDSATNRYYAWQGGANNDSKYLCPNCKRPVHYGSWLRYYCDPCNASWLDEDWLLPNFSSNEWKQITKEEYERKKGGAHLDIY